MANADALSSSHVATSVAGNISVAAGEIVDKTKAAIGEGVDLVQSGASRVADTFRNAGDSLRSSSGHQSASVKTSSSGKTRDIENIGKEEQADKSDAKKAKRNSILSKIGTIATGILVGLMGVACLFAVPFCPPMAILGLGLIGIAIVGTVKSLKDEGKQEKAAKAAEEEKAATGTQTPQLNNQQKLEKNEAKIAEHRKNFNEKEAEFKGLKNDKSQREIKLGKVRQQKNDPTLANNKKLQKKLVEKEKKLTAEIKELEQKMSDCNVAIRKELVQISTLKEESKNIATVAKTDIENKIKENEAKRTKIKDQIKEFETNGKLRIQEIDKKIEELKSERPIVEAEFKKMPKEELDKIDREIEELREERAVLEDKFENLKEDLLSLMNEKLALDKEASQIGITSSPKPQSAQIKTGNAEDLDELDNDEEIVLEDEEAAADEIDDQDDEEEASKLNSAQNMDTTNISEEVLADIAALEPDNASVQDATKLEANIIEENRLKKIEDLFNKINDAERVGNPFVTFKELNDLNLSPEALKAACKVEEKRRRKILKPLESGSGGDGKLIQNEKDQLVKISIMRERIENGEKRLNPFKDPKNNPLRRRAVLAALKIENPSLSEA